MQQRHVVSLDYGGESVYVVHLASDLVRGALSGAVDMRFMAVAFGERFKQNRLIAYSVARPEA